MGNPASFRRKVFKPEKRPSLKSLRLFSSSGGRALSEVSPPQVTTKKEVRKESTVIIKRSLKNYISSLCEEQSAAAISRIL